MKKLSELAVVFGIFCLVLLVCGCASSRPSAGDLTSAPGQNESVLIFRRGFLHFANAPYAVHVDGVERFSLKANRSGRLVVPNGVYELSGNIPGRRNIHMPKRINVNSEEVTFEIRANWQEWSRIIYLDFIEKRRRNL